MSSFGQKIGDPINTSSANKVDAARRRSLRTRAVWLSFAFWFLASVLALVAAGSMLSYRYEIVSPLQTIQWQRPWVLYGLLALPLAWWGLTDFRLKRVPRLRVSNALALVRASRNTFRTHFSQALPGLRTSLLMLLVLALAGPRSLESGDEAEVFGIDIVLALDVSLSMQASDIAPNRFVGMKAVVDEFLERRPSDRIGAVVFARDAYTLMPLTSDKTALRNVVKELSLDSVDGRGTAIGNALGVSVNRLSRSRAKSRVIILLTDGDSNSGNLSPEQAAEYAKNLNIRVYTVLMGQDGSANAPVQTGRDFFGRPVWDRREYPVNPELMRRIAEMTQAQSYLVSDRASLERSFHQILDQLERTRVEDTRSFVELHPIFVLPALLFLLVEMACALFLRRFPQ